MASITRTKPPLLAHPIAKGVTVNTLSARGYQTFSDSKLGRRSNSTQATAPAIPATPTGKIVTPKVAPNVSKRQRVPGAPLSVLDNESLLRSLLVNTVSSHRYLLIPSLWILSFLTKPGRGSFLNVDKNPLLHALLKRTFYNQFCAGENQVQTQECIQGLRNSGFRGVILTYAKETVYDHESQSSHGFVAGGADIGVADALDADIETWRLGQFETIDQLGDGDILAIKLTGAGGKVTEAFGAEQDPPLQLWAALDEVVASCKSRGIQVIIDAESQKFQKVIHRVTLSLMRKFNTDGYATVYNTYQAYLKGTPANIVNHMEAANKDGFTMGLKLVRGAYISSDDRGLIHDTKEDTDNAYNKIVDSALRKQFQEYGSEGSKPFPSLMLFLASHNKYSLNKALKTHKDRLQKDLPTVPLGFAQLHGMSDELSFSLLEQTKGGTDGPGTYKCSTWGTMGECLAYLLRRALENRDAVLRTTDEYAAVKKEVWRRFKSLFGGGAVA